MKELAHLVLENTVNGKIDRKVASEILGLLKKTQANSKEIAIIGMSLKFPLANNLKEFWDILANGTDCIREVPPLRVNDCNDAFRVLNPYDQNMGFIKCGYLEEIDKFDCSFFRLNPKLANQMDPQQRLFLETAYSAIEDAGYGGTKLCGSNTGVYVGYNSQPLYSIMSNAAKEVSELILIGATPSLIPSRVSYLLNLRGPSILVDTACSSSLVAIHLACQAIRTGECDLAIAGGVKIHLNPVKSLITLGLESPDNITKTFDDESNGTVLGEGVAAILLKPLDKALQDRDQIYAVIKGSALNQDGTSMGITAPNVKAQEEVIIAAWRDAGIDPETISYIEAHGTGTQFGDPIEIEGLRRAFQRYTNRKQFCAIGTVKTNLGHLDSASGMASLIKTILALKKQQLPASLHFQRPNRKIHFENSPIFVNDRLTPWDKGDTPRRCGISAFGLSGTNCHIILEEAPKIAPAETAVLVPRILALSALTEDAIKELIRAYQNYLTEEPTINIDDLCYTANTGRGHYNHRLLIFFQDFDDLKVKIDILSQTDLNKLFGPEIFYGQFQMISDNKRMKKAGELTLEEKRSLDINANRVIDELATYPELGNEKLHQLISELGLLYIQGADFQWDRIYHNVSRQKLNIPGYPFQRERCWLEFDNLNWDIDKVTKVRPFTQSTYQVKLTGRERYSEIEQRLAAIWGEVLGFKEVSVTADLFQLGGDSITMALLSSRIHQEFNVELKLRQIFESSTIETIGGIIEKAPKSIYTSIKGVSTKEYYPVSSAQLRLYILDQFGETGTSYNIPGVFEVVGDLNRERFEKTLQHLIGRHESFRTSFTFTEGKPVQRIHPSVNFHLNYQELASEADCGETISRIIQEFIRPFDLSQAPLVRAGLLKITDSKHLLMFDMHHIIADGVSMNILIRDFAAIYNGEQLADLKVQYKDFSEWQHDSFQGETIKRQETYWLNRFAGEIPVLDLPTDYSRPVVQSFAGEVVQFTLDLTLTERLNELAVQNGATLYMVLLAAYTILLSKYSGQEDIVVGSPIAGRPHADLENIIGMFVNTLAMRNQPEGNKTFQEFLAEVKAGALQAYENQDYPFEELVEKLDLKRDLSRNPLFDCMFVLQNMRMEVQTIGELDFRAYPMRNETTKFDLTLQVFEQNGELVFALEYAVKLFKPETIQRMMRHFRRLVEEVASQPGLKISELEMLTEVEKRQLIYEFNDTKAGYPHDKTIMELFEEQAERTPGHIAIVHEDRQMTYKELNQKANQLARALRKKGVQTESIVGIVVERSLEMLIGIFGILKAGGAYLPIAPDYPEERIKFMLADSGTGILLTQSHLKEKYNVKQEIIDLDNEVIYDTAKTNLKVASQPQGLAYVIYTSGSTGRPKGVMIEHYSLTNRLHWMQQKYPLNTNDTILQKTPYVFDVSVWELLWWSICGAKLSILKPRGEKDPREIIAAIQKNQVTTIHFVPSMLTAFLAEVERDGNTNKVGSLRHVFASGEALNAQQVKRFNRIFNGKAQLHNLYGPTEATIDVSYYDCISEIETIPIGKPIDNIRLYVGDSNLNLCPVGITGELYIAGDGVARGYLNRPELTKEKFVTNPFIPEERMYKTGDLARWLPDGNIEFLGRIDQQVKIRGFRIELGEIESQLVKYEGIQEAVVIWREDKTGTGYLCAYLTAQKELSVGEIREYLAKEMPDYMIPSYFVQLEKLPLTPNGKLDQKALLEPEGNIINNAEYEAPRTETEKELVTFWEELLEAVPIGIHDNFFETGGHSLKAMVLASRIHKRFNVEISLEEIFKKPTIQELAKYIDQAEKNIYHAIKPVTKKEYYPVSSSQKRLYILDQLEGAGTSYNIPGVFEVVGDLNRERFEKTFQQLIGRHESFRTSFELIEGEPVQRIHPEVDFNLNYQELAFEAAGSKETMSRILQEFIRPFDLSRAPLVRAGLLKISDSKHLLVFDMHHIIADGTSMQILIRDFAAIYNGEQLADLKVQYKDFSEWQHESFQGETLKQQETYWLNRFAGEIPVLDLPTDYPRPTVQSFAGEVVQFTLDRTLTKGLNQLAVQNGATLYMVLLAAYTILLSKYSGQEDIVVGSPIAGRPHADLENIIGMFVNTLAMRNLPAGNKTFQEFLAEVKAGALQAYENQDYPFEELVETLELKRDLSRNPLFESMFVLQNMEMETQTIGELNFSPYPLKNETAKFDLTLFALEQSDEMFFILEYGVKLFKPETIRRMIGHFRQLLSEILAGPEKRLAELGLLTKAEKDQLLYEFNQTEAGYPKEKTLPELIETRAGKAPDQIALIYEGKEITYREINEQANRLGHRLIEAGVQAGEAVGLMMKRSPEMIIGILGILKSGAVCLPLDVKYPQERIKYVLKDSGARMAINSKGYEAVAYAGNWLEYEPTKLTNYQSDNLQTKISAADPAYLIYTSGSTGTPKGVLVHHYGISNHAYTKIRETGLTGTDRVSHTLSINFVASIWLVVAPLIQGGSIVLYDESTMNNPYELFKQIARDGVTICEIIPSVLQSYLESIKNGQARIELPHLRKLILTGERVRPELVNQYYQEYEIGLVNAYGQSECSDDTLHWQIPYNRNTVTVAIGKPSNNTQVYILGKEQQLQPIGVRGELCISGDGLALGYLNNPDLTADKFIENPYQAGTRLYRTGDQVRWLADGNIEYLGRLDQQVKIRGHRIELGEIESWLMKHEFISEAVVLDQTAQEEEKYLCAYIVTKQAVGNEAIREYLGKELPEYMIPARYIQLEKLPLTPNGKIDRNALQKSENTQSLGEGYVAPRNEIEQKLAQIWEEILHLERVGIKDNFLELGGHSLNIMTLISRVYKEFEVELQFDTFFEGADIETIAAYIREAEKSIYESIQPVEPKEYYLVSSAQKRLYILEKLEQVGISYNMPGVYEVKGRLDKDRLEETFRQLIKRHESFRTSFGLVEGEPVQWIHPEVEFRMNYQELDSGESNIQEIISGIIREFFQPFDLSKAPLIRTGLVKISDNQYLLIFDMHHIIADGASMNILIRDFAALYNGERLADLRIQYKEYSEWQNRLFQNGGMKKQEEYWLRNFRGEIPVLKMPTDYERPLYRSFEGEYIHFQLSQKQTFKLRQMVQDTETTLNIFILAVYNVLLSKYSGQDDIVVGVLTTGRPHVDLEGIVGVFINTLPIRNYPKGGKTFREFLAEVKDNTLNGYENQAFQFEKLIERLELPTDRSRNPLFDTMIITQNLEQEVVRMPEFQITPYRIPQNTTKFDFTLQVLENNTQIIFILDYYKALFKNDTMMRLTKRFINIIQEVLDEPDRILAKIEKVVPEKELILNDFNENLS